MFYEEPSDGAVAMGVESAVYEYLPTSGALTKARAALIGAGAVVVDDQYLVLRGCDHWIDIQVDTSAQTVRLRMAFSNPQSSIMALRRAFETLAGAEPGKVVDVASRERFASADTDALQRLIDEFGRRRDEFQSTFGPLTAVVSANEVFDRVHAERDGP